MAGTAQSDDSSDIFWPGYVDAVTNVAIMLLFAVAISSIVVLGTSIQIARQKVSSGTSTDKSRLDTELPHGSVEGAKHGVMGLTRTAALDYGAKGEGTQDQAAQIENAKTGLDAALQAQNQLVKENQQLEQKIKDLQARLEKAQQQAAASPGKSSEFVVQARPRAAPKDGAQALEATEDGLVVVFAPDTIELTDAEQAELVRKLAANGPLSSARWQLTVRSPKGFSEAARVGFYRLNTLRNLLIRNGVPSDNISIQLQELDNGGNNARVVVKRLP